MTIFQFITTVLHLYLHNLHLPNLHLYLPNLHLYCNVLEKSTFLYYYIFKELRARYFFSLLFSVIDFRDNFYSKKSAAVV